MRLDSCFFILCRGSEVAHHARRLVSPSCLLSSIPPPAWRGARAHSGFASSARALAAWERRGHTRARPGKRERERERAELCAWCRDSRPLVCNWVFGVTIHPFNKTSSPRTPGTAQPDRAHAHIRTTHHAHSPPQLFIMQQQHRASRQGPKQADPEAGPPAYICCPPPGPGYPPPGPPG
jgi:hypothetical protein